MQVTLATTLKRTLTVIVASTSWLACGGESNNLDSAGSGGAGVTPPVSMFAGSSATAGAGSAITAGTNGAASTSGSGGTSAAGTSAGGSAVAGSAAAGTSATAGSSGSAATAGASGSAGPIAVDKFSFFVASYTAMKRLAGNEAGFGGDLRYGQADGLAGADKICTEIAETSLKGAGQKGWRAFLSVTKGPDGNPVHAINRVGEGPWYDRLGRLIAANKTDLMTTRPTGADPLIVNDLPNEDGVPNMAPDGEEVDNHDILTGTNEMGQVFSTDWGFTCHDWTSKNGPDGTPRVGHSWPRMLGGGGFPFPFPGGMPPGGMGGPGGFGDMNNWMSALNEAGCAPGASLLEMGPPNPDDPTVGSGGGYGGIYCFALMP